MPLSQPIPFERLQPCLFDRLIDHDVQNKEESRMARVIPLSAYRKAVERDLMWLLNSSKHAAFEELEEFPMVESSVYNFGIPILAGMTIAQAEEYLESELARSLEQFEPRILKNSLQVRVVRNAARGSLSTLTFEISAKLWARPFPEKLFIKTALDIETGEALIPQ